MTNKRSKKMSLTTLLQSGPSPEREKWGAHWGKLKSDPKNRVKTKKWVSTRRITKVHKNLKQLHLFLQNIILQHFTEMPF